MIKLTLTEWAAIRERLVQEYPPSVIIIREVMKRELGFTVRRHREWIEQPGHEGYYPRDNIYLDFYNDNQETFFRLKYL